MNTKKMVLCAMFTALTAIGAFIKIPLPYFEYFTLQLLFVIMSGLILGSRLGGLSVLLYVVIGLVGFPVFAAGGGPGYILKPTFGYLVGFVVAAYVTGYIEERIEKKSFRASMVASIAGMIIIYAVGIAYKYVILNVVTKVGVPLPVMIMSSVPMEVPGDLILCIAASIINVKFRKLASLHPEMRIE